MKRTQWLLLIVLSLPPSAPVRAPAVTQLASELAQRLQDVSEEKRPRC